MIENSRVRTYVHLPVLSNSFPGLLSGPKPIVPSALALAQKSRKVTSGVQDCTHQMLGLQSSERFIEFYWVLLRIQLLSGTTNPFQLSVQYDYNV